MPSERLINAELYLEGQLVPFSQLVLSAQPNSPAQLQAILPPIPGLVDIPVRTLVHVFYEDKDRQGNTDEKKRLLFEGEVTGHGFAKTPSGRSFTLYCEDLNNYFRYVYMYLFTDLENFAALPGLVERSFFATTGIDTEQELRFDVTGKGSVLDEILREPSPPNAFIRLIKAGLEANRGYSATSARLRIPDRIAALDDEDIAKLFDSLEAETLLFGQAVRSLPPYADLNQIMLHAMGVHYYYYVPVPAASVCAAAASGVGSIIFKPLTYFSPAPMCNVLFPDQYSSLNFTRNHLAEPTRLHLTPFSIVGQEFSKVYMAPPSLITAIENEGTSNPVDPEAIKRAIIDSTFIRDVSHPSREDIKGIVPIPYQFQNAEVLRGFINEAGKDSEEVIDKYFSNIAQYELLKAQHAPRGAEFTGIFNPALVVGFPSLVLDREAFVFGELMSLTHVISSEGQAQTAGALLYCRNKDVLDETGEKALDYGTVFPWINKKFLDKDVGDPGGAYEQLLGKGMLSILKEVPSEAENKPQLKAANTLMDKYDLAPNKDEFVSKQTLRDIVTKKKLLEGVLGATRTNAMEYTGGPFRQTILDIVKPLAQTLRTKREYHIT